MNRLFRAVRRSTERVTAPPGVLPAQDSGLQPVIGAVILQRLSEGDRFVGLQRSVSSPGRPHHLRDQLAGAAHLHTS